MYKNAMPLFCALFALFALLRILLAWRVVRKLAGRRALSGSARGLRVTVQSRPESDAQPGMWAGGNRETTLGFGKSPAPEAGTAPLPTSTHVFLGIAHPGGTFTLFRSYLTTPTFTLESLETLLSSRFAVLDARPMPLAPLAPTPPLPPPPDPPPPPTSTATTAPAAPRYHTDHAAQDEADNEEFVHTLARHSIMTSTTSAASMGSPGR
ncbi:hypothetical protein B0H19DRAFT_540027 [Mycena capillaripes]|nr:hypothetical protein B0H19DRAFT_540027 [Mycena capillaripes]